MGEESLVIGASGCSSLHHWEDNDVQGSPPPSH